MTSWINESRMVKDLAERLLSSKRANYQQDYIKYKVIECNHIRFQNSFTINKYGEKLKTTVFVTAEMEHTCCVVYLHGYGSHRVEGTSILSALPRQLALCCFDFSGSGKSQGQISTYGKKQHEDIQAILKMLREKYGFKKFVLWGRSMGAVASLLYTSKTQQPDIVFQILDSPFSSFQKIAEHHAKEVIRFPDLFISLGLGIVKDHFKDHPYDPFQLNVNETLQNCKVPALFVYCVEDKVIPAENSLSIIENFGKRNTYQRLIIPENHNNFRSLQTLNRIFQIAHKYWHSEKIRQRNKHKKGIFEIVSNSQTPKESRSIMRLSGQNRRSRSKNRSSKLMTQQSLKNPEDEVISRIFCFRSCSKPQE